MKKSALAIISLLGITTYAQVEEVPVQEQPQNELKEIIIQGNRIQLPFGDAARDIQVITHEQIEQMPATSLNQVLSYVSGVDIRQRGPFGTQADISIDGGTSEQTIILINGVKMLDSQTAHNMMNVPVPLSAIAHIEVLRGAAARVYGINALTGAINIVTKKDRQPMVTAIVQGGSSFKSKEDQDGSGIYAGGSAEVTANFSNQDQRHLVSLAQSTYNGQRYNSAANNTRLFYNGSYEFDATNRIQAMAGYARSRFGANGFYAAPADRESEEIVQSSIFSLSSEHQWGDFTFAPRISNRYGEDDYRFYRDNLASGRSLHYTNALMIELNSRLVTNFGTLGFGLESRLEEINSSNIGEHTRDNHGLYAELASNMGSRLTGTLGLYADYNTDFGWQVYPGLDLAYHINTNWKVSTSIGAGQRIPSFTDLYLNQLPGNLGNEFLQPENSWNYEGNLQYKRNNMNLQVGYFYRSITDFIDWVRPDASHPYSPINFGENNMHGFYARVRQDFSLGDNQSFGYRVTYNNLQPSLEASPEEQSKYVLESLKHQLIGGVHYQVGPLSVHLENRWLQRELADAYNVTDIRINYQWDDVRLFTEATNLFDASYSEAGAVPMPTRWISIGLQYQWN